MDVVPGIPAARAQEWARSFAELNLLPPKVKYAQEHPGTDLGTAKEKALFQNMGLPLPGEDPLDPWLFSWAVGERQPAVQLKHLYAGDFEEMQGVVANPGALPALSMRKAITAYAAVIATRTRLILARGTKKKAFSKAEPLALVLEYRDIHAYDVGAAHLMIRSNAGPVVHLEWKQPGSTFMQVGLELGAAWGKPDTRVVSAMAADRHGRELAQQRVGFRDAIRELAEEMQTVSRAFS